MIRNESDLQRISRKTGRKLISCKCVTCKTQCQSTPCLGTPSDIEKIIDAGHGDKIKSTYWGTGALVMGVTDQIIDMYQPEKIEGHGCAFYKDGLCILHDAGLKPTEGKLSHHTIRRDNHDPTRSLSWQVSKEWIDPKNQDTILRIQKKLL